jgi:hypothetical protein
MDDKEPIVLTRKQWRMLLGCIINQQFAIDELKFAVLNSQAANKGNFVVGGIVAGKRQRAFLGTDEDLLTALEAFTLERDELTPRVPPDPKRDP